MEVKRDLNFEVKTCPDLSKMLLGLVMDVRRGEIGLEATRCITLVVDKINKNHVNALEYKKIAKHKNPIAFFEGEEQ